MIMVEVKFSKQWRGHDPGTVVALEDWRAKELIDGGYCKSTAEVEKPKRTRKVKTITPSKVFAPSEEVKDDIAKETKDDPSS